MEVTGYPFLDYINEDKSQYKHAKDAGFVDDDDLLIWLETKGKDSYIVNEVDYYGSFSLWLDGCPYSVNPDSVEIK